jgi:hypothetical protein
LKCFAEVLVLILSHAIANGVMTNITNILAVLGNFLNKIMLSGVIDVVVALDLG